jgi:antigen flippase
VPDHRRIASLGLHTLASQIVIYGSGFVSSVIIARALGPEGRGLYVVPIALVTIVVSLSSQGLDLAQVRLWARMAGSRARLLTSATWLSGLVGAFGAVIAWLVYEAGRSGPFE